MNEEQCSQESDVRGALDAGGLTDELRRHVSTCASCGESVRVARFMKGVAGVMAREAMPDARAMWSRHQLEEQRRLTERAQRPVRIAWRFAKYWCACVAGLVLYREWPALGDFMLSTPDQVWIGLAIGAAIYAKGRGLVKKIATSALGSVV